MSCARTTPAPAGKVRTRTARTPSFRTPSLRNLRAAWDGIEVRPLLEPEEPRRDIAREGEDGRVEVADPVVVSEAFERDAVLRPRDFKEKVLDDLDGLEVRVILDDGDPVREEEGRQVGEVHPLGDARMVRP